MTPTHTFRTHVRPALAGVRLPLFVLVFVGVVFVIAVAASRQSHGGGAGCGQIAAGQIIESQKFTPYSSRMTQTPDQPINPTGAALQVPDAALSAPSTIDGRPLQWVAASADGGFEAIYFDRPIDRLLTGSVLAAEGALWFDHQPKTNSQSFADFILAEHADRAVAVDIGANPGVIVWADPGPSGVRSHNLYWSDGKFEFGLIAVRPAEVIVNLGRGIACAAP